MVPSAALAATLRGGEPAPLLPSDAPFADPPLGATALRTVEIKDDAGRVLFRQDVLAPASWSDRAVKIAASKYLWGDAERGTDPMSGGREGSIYQLHARVADFVAAHAADQGLCAAADAFRLSREIEGLTLGQSAAFNSPVWFNVGLDGYLLENDETAWGYSGELGPGSRLRDTYRHPQVSACFIQGVDDNMESLMQLARNEAMLFKGGSGSGTDFSRIRSCREKLTGGGTPSGPLSFMAIYDCVAAVVKSGGKTRRAAKMQTISIGHPDIELFIRAKGVEEEKAHALIAAGYDGDFNGEAYGSVKFQNANFSVRVPRTFLRCLDRAVELAGDEEMSPVGWPLRAVTTDEVLAAVDPRTLWRAIAEETWRCGDPGVQFTDTINDWHTCPVGMDGRPTPIRCSNPCSEYLFIDDSACNLASLNLMKFLADDGTFDVARYRAAVRRMILAMETLVDAGGYPTREIAMNSHNFRPLGLGFANLGGMLQASGLAYDSELARAVAAAVAAILTGEAYTTSALMAARKGPFPGYTNNEEPMRRVISRHREAAVDLGRTVAALPARHLHKSPLVRQLGRLAEEAHECWCDTAYLGNLHGYRNAQASVIAPTGTIAFMMDCDTTGIEPNLALSARKNLAGGGSIPVVNQLVQRALAALGYYRRNNAFVMDTIERHIALHGTAERCPYLADEDVAVFDTSFAPPGFARTLRPEAHLLMMAAVQPFVSGAISKTVNLPADATVEEIAACYRQAERLGLKSVAIYRDGSKGSQPLEASGSGGVLRTCHGCGGKTLVRAGTCGLCPTCGSTTGCS